ncbi:MAG: hypothetical protein J6A92_02750 [Lachnospiraceae bacterium]|nr:hypothetical protein [Lachnospiraceae bacterium]
MNYWKKSSSPKKRNSLWTLGMGLGMVLLLIGFLDGQLEEIYRKAVMICLECIGIG